MRSCSEEVQWSPWLSGIEGGGQRKDDSCMRTETTGIETPVFLRREDQGTGIEGPEDKYTWPTKVSGTVRTVYHGRDKLEEELHALSSSQ